jgi:hypothetical protein
MELSMDKHMEQLEAVVADIKGTDIYLGHNWLVKHNLKIDWKEGIIRLANCPHDCKITHQDITFKKYN